MRYGNKTQPNGQVSKWVNPQKNFLFPSTLAVPAGVSVSADASTHTKGAWLEIVASTSEAYDFIIINCVNAATSTATEGLGDIGIGASGSETVIVPNFISGGITESAAYRPQQLFPVSIPAGSRISVRTQNVVGSRASGVAIGLYRTGLPSPPSVDSLTANTATSRNFNLVGNDTWNEVVASTSIPYRALVAFPQCATNAVAAATAVRMALGVGASGSEVEVGVMFASFSASEFCGPSSLSNPIIYWPENYIPAGSRIAAKIATAVATRDIAIWGVP